MRADETHQIQTTIFRHPVGLAVCVFTEMWERFAYYGILSLVILYVTQAYGFSDAEGNRVVGAYGALTWMMPVLGGIIGDRYLGEQRSVILGCILMAIGAITASFPQPFYWLTNRPWSTAAAPSFDLLLLSFALVVVGVGFLKSNLAAIVGAQYDADDPRREAGFTIFYAGINAGGALGPLVCGALGQIYGLRYGFAAAGAAMAIALTAFTIGRSYLADRRFVTNLPKQSATWSRGFKLAPAIASLGSSLIVLAWFSLRNESVLHWLMGGMGFSVSIFMISVGTRTLSGAEARRLLAVLVMLCFTAVFAALNLQMFGSLTLFCERFVDRSVFGYEIATAQIQSLPSIFVILLAPVMASLWTMLSRRSRRVSTGTKFSVGLFFTGAAFLIPMGFVLTASSGDKMPIACFAMIYLVMIVGEVCLIPIAMTIVSKFSPANLSAMMMGIYYFALALGSMLGGELAALWASGPGGHALSAQSMLLAMNNYAIGYAYFATAAIVAAAIFMLLWPRLRIAD